MYVKTTLCPVVATKYLSPPSADGKKLFEKLWIEAKVNNSTYVIIGYYRHPNTNINDFSNAFLNSLDRLKTVKKAYIFGDINLDASQYSKHTIPLLNF